MWHLNWLYNTEKTAHAGCFFIPHSFFAGVGEPNGLRLPGGRGLASKNTAVRCLDEARHENKERRKRGCASRPLRLCFRKGRQIPPPQPKRKVAQAAFSFCTLHYYLFTLHSSLFTFHSSLFTFHSSLFTLHSSLFSNSPARLFRRRDKREERKEKVAFLPLVEKHFLFYVESNRLYGIIDIEN